MAKRQPEFYVMVPYKELLRLLEVSSRVDEYEQELDHVKNQQAALRGQFLELMEKFKEL